FSDEEDDLVPPLALSPEQIVKDVPTPEPQEVESERKPAAAPSVAPGMIVPDDLTFAQDKDEEPMAKIQPEPEVKPASFAQAAPMPDPDLSTDLAEQLLEPATTAAVRSAFAKLDTPRLTPE